MDHISHTNHTSTVVVHLCLTPQRASERSFHDWMSINGPWCRCEHTSYSPVAKLAVALDLGLQSTIGRMREGDSAASLPSRCSSSAQAALDIPICSHQTQNAFQCACQGHYMWPTLRGNEATLKRKQRITPWVD